MKVNSQLRNLKRTLNVQVNLDKISSLPDLGLIKSKWKGVIDNIESILTNGNSEICYQELYHTTNDLLLFDIPSDVSQAIEMVFYQTALQCSEVFGNLVNSNDNPSQFFDKFNVLWTNITQNFSLLRKILIKFERKCYGKNLQQCSVFAIFLEFLKKELLAKKRNFLEFLINCIMSKILMLREEIFSILQVQVNEDSLNQALACIKQGIEFLWETGMYKEIFTESFLQTSTEFYVNMSQKILNSSQSIESYVNFVETAFELENRIITLHLNENTLKPMINILEARLICDKKSEILQKFFGTACADPETVNIPLSSIFIDRDRLILLKKIYNIYKKIKIDDELKKRWIEYIHSSAVEIYNQLSGKYLQLFEHLIAFKQNIDTCVRDAFLADEKFKAAAKDGLSKSINLKPNFIADYFSRYIDYILTLSDTDEKAIMEKIDEFMSIFRLLEAKDAFELFYIKKLANRLLYNLTTSRVGESYLIDKLKSECGTVFVTKSEEMLSDINNSNELTLTFTQEDEKVKFNFYVLSTYSWPISKIITGFVTDGISLIHKNFTLFYRNKYPGKALNWHLPYCSCEMTYIAGNKKCVTLHVNGVQAAILAKFTRKRENISMKELMKVTHIEKEDILYHISILTSSNHLLIYDKENDTFKLNKAFSPMKTHIHINDFSKEETSVEEILEVEERNLEDRKPVIEAYIMKILKPKKQMKLSDLIHGVISAVKFPCEVSLVTLRINHLINNHYIVRDEKDDQLIKYN